MGRPSKYPVEFREQAVSLVLDADRKINDVAKSLEMKPDTLRKWVDRARVDRGIKAGISSEDAAQLAELKKENRKLKQQVEILEKATVFFVSRGLDAHK